MTVSACMFDCLPVCVCLSVCKLFYLYFQLSQRDILNSIDREMSGDLREGFKTVGNPFSLFTMNMIL